MKFACTQENLLQGLNLVSHITGKNVNLPVLGNVLLKTEGGSLRLSTTNLELAINNVVRGKVEIDGEYSVPAKLFLDYVTLLPSGKVELTLIDEGLEVRSTEQETVFKGMLASEFPVLPKLVIRQPYELKAEDLRRTIGQVAFAVGTSETRPELMGVACFFGGLAGSGNLACVATDSYRLAERRIPVSGNTGEGRVIVPARAFVEISRIIGSYKDELSMPEHVQLSFTDNQMVMSYGSVELISRLIEGSFPDYAPLIPHNFKTEAVLSRQELQKAVRAAALFSRQGIFDVHLELDPDKGTCTVKSADQGTGKTKTVLQTKVTGDANTVMLNYRYLMDGLAAMLCDAVRIRQVDRTNPILMTPEGSEEKYRYLIMPIRQ